MRSKGSFQAIITVIVIMTSKNEGNQVGPSPRGRPRRQEEGDRRERDFSREQRCFASTFSKTLLLNDSGFVFFIQTGCAKAFSFCSSSLPPYLPRKNLERAQLAKNEQGKKA